MDLLEASRQAKLDPFSCYTGAIARMTSVTGRPFWLIWINEEDDPIVHRWFPHSNVDIPDAIQQNIAEAIGKVNLYFLEGEADWQPASDTTNNVFRDYIDSHLLWLTFRVV